MSERYGGCRNCGGYGGVYYRTGVVDPHTKKEEQRLQECPSCDGTGHSGDATDYMQREAEKEAKW